MACRPSEDDTALAERDSVAKELLAESADELLALTLDLVELEAETELESSSVDVAVEEFWARLLLSVSSEALEDLKDLVSSEPRNSSGAEHARCIVLVARRGVVCPCSGGRRRGVVGRVCVLGAAATRRCCGASTCGGGRIRCGTVGRSGAGVFF